ncbi:MAG: SDR family oxidoreductase [Ignavibacteriales bacterium]|nr:SDR family oxidoreductase [Ignavibacteriales bacterium]
MAHFLVTGGAGFIGSNIVAELVKRGERVRVLDNFSTGNRENLRPFGDSIELVEGSLTDFETVRIAARGVDVVLHQGALPSVPRSIEQPLNSNEVNAGGTLNVLVASRDEGVKRVVFASSSSIYGDVDIDRKHEGLPPRPLSPYAVAKMAAEYYAKVFFKLYGLEAVALRYFNVFGPRQNPDSQYSAVIPKFIKMMMNGKQPVIFGDGLQSRDFSYVENIVLANLLAASAPRMTGETLNIACGETRTLLDLVNGLNKALGTTISPIFQPIRKGDVMHSLADISLAERTINYKPTVGWEEGLKRTVQWYVELEKGNRGTGVA